MQIKPELQYLYITRNWICMQLHFIKFIDKTRVLATNVESSVCNSSQWMQMKMPVLFHCQNRAQILALSVYIWKTERDFTVCSLPVSDSSTMLCSILPKADPTWPFLAVSFSPISTGWPFRGKQSSQKLKYMIKYIKIMQGFLTADSSSRDISSLKTPSALGSASFLPSFSCWRWRKKPNNFVLGTIGG